MSTKEVKDAPPTQDVLECARVPTPTEKKVSAFKALGWLDRYLAVWIFLAMVIGILLGNFVPHIGQSLQRGQFVEVSVPIGKALSAHPFSRNAVLIRDSNRSFGHDVSDSLQRSV